MNGWIPVHVDIISSQPDHRIFLLDFHVSPSLTNHFPNNQPRGGNPSLRFDTFYQLHLQRDDDDTYCGTMIMAAITRTPATYDYLGTATHLLSLWDCYQTMRTNMTSSLCSRSTMLHTMQGTRNYDLCLSILIEGTTKP